MKPTVGRIVHFYTSNKSRQSNGQGEGPYAALVTQTFSGSDFVNLKVLPPMAAPYDVGSVAPGPDETADRYWLWPPRE